MYPDENPPDDRVPGGPGPIDPKDPKEPPPPPK